MYTALLVPPELSAEVSGKGGGGRGGGGKENGGKGGGGKGSDGRGEKREKGASTSPPPPPPPPLLTLLHAHKWVLWAHGPERVYTRRGGPWHNPWAPQMRTVERWFGDQTAIGPHPKD